MATKDILGLTVIAALVTTMGSILAMFIKEYFLAKYFDDLRERRTLEKIFKQYKDPIILTSCELMGRINEILKHYPAIYLKSENLKLNPNKIVLSTIEDKYFQKYKLTSTIYRFCSVLGWMELYRQEITFLESHSSERTIKLLTHLDKLKSSIADGQLNTHEDWETWADSLIFREETRAIGEGMIIDYGNKKVIMGYGQFGEIFSEFVANRNPKWLNQPVNFFIDCEIENDFRLERLRLISLALFELVNFFDEEFCTNEFTTAYHDNMSKVDSHVLEKWNTL